VNYATADFGDLTEDGSVNARIDRNKLNMPHILAVFRWEIS
jgi:hypothetical protein